MTGHGGDLCAERVHRVGAFEGEGEGCDVVVSVYLKQ